MNPLHPISPSLFFLLVVAVMASRYVFFSGGAFLLLKLGKARFQKSRIQPDFPNSNGLRLELFYSASTILIFGLIAFIVQAVVLQGHTQVYFEVSDQGWAYLILSVILLMLLHDSYFYWAHRLMHHPRFFRWTHKVHHIFTNPSPFTTYSLHPGEAFIEAIYLPISLFFLPLHPIAIFSFITIDYLYNLLGHLGYEFYPQGFVHHPVGKYFNTSTHHNMHHAHFNSNYGLYFNFWDRICGTNHPKYLETFDQITSRNRNSL